jgi:hypothetical protein
VNQVRPYFLLFFLLGTFGAFGQKQDASTIAISFADSVRIVLENTKTVSGSVVGSSFASAWNSLPLDQQLIIQKQVRLMKRKKFAVKPALITYFGAIANAVNIEHADKGKIAGFLMVASEVIEKEPPAKAVQFFKSCSNFFQYHALYYDKVTRLYARDDDYQFEYIAPVQGFDLTAPQSESGATESPEEETIQEASSSGDDDGYDDESAQDTTQNDFYAEAPLWMNPPPPPTLEGPVIRFSRVTLNFVSRYDSVFLRNSKGVLSLRDDIFVGETGTFDWTPAGLGPDVVICELTVYDFKVTKSEVKSNLARLKYEGKTPGFIPGTFEFKSQARKDSVLSTYPRFKSFQHSLDIKGIADENVKYTGGFSLTGNKVSGASVGGEESQIQIFRNGQEKFSARSREFIFGESSVISNKARVSMQLQRDSITHPAVRFKYSWEGDSIQKITIRKEKGMMKHTPYSSSYFNVDFAADVIKWDLSADSLNVEIDGARNTVPVVIESVDYYDPEDYRILKGDGFSFHPVALVASYCLSKNVREFYGGDLAYYASKEPRDIKAAMEFLSEKGLITYNPTQDKAIVKEKLILLYKGARGEMDYDNLKILSVIDSFPNATVNYQKGYMTVRGVEEFDVSDSLNVKIEPDSSVITLLKNRDIQFNGTINAGNFEISGKGFTLKYDSFYITLTHIDSINFFVTEKNSRGQSVRRKINNSMVGADSTAAAAGGLGDTSKSSGTLFISRANNKSGKKKIPNYPRLNASTGGVIYFDRHEVLDGAYDRSVFFVVPPFKLDSLNDADPSSINFDGTFVSSGMFPTFKEKLHTQADKSLGFTHSIPAGGYAMYNGDAQMKGNLSLDNRGIRGDGTISFLAATVTSPDFIFYPDSVIARGTQASIEEKQLGPVNFPEAKLLNFDMKWYPKDDKMKLKNLNAPFEFYNATAQMRGTVTISPQGVGGSGKFETRGTELISRDMTFTSTDFRARRARFRVKSEDPEKPLLTGTDVRIRYNLEQNYADVSPEIAGVAAIDFPYAQFKTSIPNMRWDVNAQKITMSKAPDQPIEDSYFYTTRKDLDSLSFNADKAEYDLKTQELKVSGIPYIIVADAKITPENNEVLILENAKIGTLKNTTIVLDTLNGYHLLTEGVVDIKSRKEFSGYATYQYVNLLQDTFSIKMTDFHLENISEDEETKQPGKKSDEEGRAQQTVATGAVADKDLLVLGAGMYYKGDMTMYASRPALQLNGFIKLDIKNIPDYMTWIKYEQSGDETEVMFEFDNAVTEEGDDVNAGLHFNNANNDLYITFVSKKKSPDDEDFFVPSGMLLYDTSTLEFKIEDIQKSKGQKLSGKVFAYNDLNRQVRFEGPVNLFKGTKDFNITSTAIGQGNIETNEIRMNSFLLMDSNVPEAAFDVMGKQLQEVIKNEGADEGLGDATELLYKIADIVGEKVVKDYEQRSLQGYVPLATIPQLAKPIAFSNVNLKWSAERKAFYSEGKLGISNVGKNDINGAFEGFMEIRKDEDGLPVFHVFFKASPEAWYYFGFEDNRLMIQSSYGAFNDVINKKTNARKAKVGEIAFIPGSEEETVAFINRFRKTYYGIDVPYSLYEAQEAPSDQAPPTIMPNVTTEETPKEKPKKQRKQKRDQQEPVDNEAQPQDQPQDKPQDKPEDAQQTPPSDEPAQEEKKKEEEKQEDEDEDDGF